MFTACCVRSLAFSRSVVVALACLCLAQVAHAQRSTPIQLLHPAGAAADNFGQAVAIDGDTMIVGAPGDDVGANAEQGSAHVYRWTGSGWTLEATLTASDGALGDLFGNAVSVSGDTAVIGASGDDIGANVEQGSAYVFTRSGTTWTQQAKLTASGGAASDLFGNSVAISGETALVGAYNDSVGANSNQGSAYVFTRSGTTWTQQAQLNSSDGTFFDSFGKSVALSGDTALIGAQGDDVGANSDQGSAYVFTRSGTTWTQQAQLTATGGAVLDSFGISVALSGDTALVGAYSDNVGAIVDQGSAFVFTRTGSTWTQQAQLNASAGAAGDFFGVSVALSGETALVGAYGDDVGANNAQGSAAVFTRSGTSWTQQVLLTASDGAANDFFGGAVALWGDTAVAGAYNDNVGANADQGSVGVFSRVGTKWIGLDLTFVASDGAANDNFGTSVAISGDTAVVGAAWDDVGVNPDQGSAYVFTRAGTTWTQQAKLVASDGAAFDIFGYSVAVSGDTAVIGAPQDDLGGVGDEGSAYVFTRSGTTWTQQAKLTAADGATADFFGYSVAASGDTIIVGAWFDDNGANSGQGSAYVFTRSGSTWTQQAKLIAPDGAAGDTFGNSVALSGDYALIGAESDAVGANTLQGSAYIFARSGIIWTQQAKITAADGAADQGFGGSVALSGDTALVGAFKDDVGGNSNQGSAYVFVRIGSQWTQQAKLIASGGSADDWFGYSVALSGDTAIVGELLGDEGADTNNGSAYMFARADATWTQQAVLTARSGTEFDARFGNSVAISGDTAVVGVLLDDVGANIAQGSVWTFDVPANNYSFAHNDSLEVTYPSLAAAFLPAQSGHQITASTAAWESIGNLDTLGRSLGLAGAGDVRTPSTSTITLGGSSYLSSPVGSVVDIFGQLRVSSGASADITTDAFTLGSRGLMTARTNSSLTINAPAARLDGQTRLEQGASMTFAGSATAIGATTVGLNSSLTLGGTFSNCDTFTITSGTITGPLFWNRGLANVFGASAIFGSFANDAGATTTIRSGTLFVFGGLTNNGTIVGTLCSTCLGTAPNLDVAGSLSLGPAANLMMPFTDSTVHVGGSFDCAINSNTRYDMSIATLQLEGTGGEQALEVMSTDIGPSENGLNRTLAGHYPIGTLHVGASASTVRLVDAHDNDSLGQGTCEALYVDALRIDAGSRLINTSCRIYYNTLTNNGVVDVPANLVPIQPACAADVDDDGSFPGGNPDGGVDVNDLLFFLAAFEAGDVGADLDNGTNTGTPDGGVDVSDLLFFLGRFEAGC